MSEIVELLLAQIWNSQWIRQPLRTTDGQPVQVVYPGVWTHGFGPDFKGAMLAMDNALVAGDVEIELEVSGWYTHGHDQNEAFNDVVLQIVSRESDAPLVRRMNGGKVPRVVLTEFLAGELDAFAEQVNLRPLGAIGFETCAPGVSADQPELIRDIWRRAGDRRMQEKVAAISGEFALQPPAQVLYARTLDALGFSRNRRPMTEIAARLMFEQLGVRLEECDATDRFWRAASLLLGIGGFLPLSPRDAAIAGLEPAQIGRIEREWAAHGTPWHGLELSPDVWTFARLRPAGHPVRRLLAGAVIVASATDGLIAHLIGCLTESSPRRSLLKWLAGENPYLGDAHAHELIVNVMIPFALAYGSEAQQDNVTEAAAEVWQSIPAGRGNAIIRQTREQICGAAVISPRSARAEQGLIHIHRNGCSQMRCYECPIAHLALHYETGNGIEFS